MSEIISYETDLNSGKTIKSDVTEKSNLFPLSSLFSDANSAFVEQDIDFLHNAMINEEDRKSRFQRKAQEAQETQKAQTFFGADWSRYSPASALAEAAAPQTAPTFDEAWRQTIMRMMGIATAEQPSTKPKSEAAKPPVSPKENPSAMPKNRQVRNLDESLLEE